MQPRLLQVHCIVVISRRRSGACLQDKRIQAFPDRMVRAGAQIPDRRVWVSAPSLGSVQQDTERGQVVGGFLSPPSSRQMSPEVFTQLEARIEGLGVDFRVDDGGVSRVLLLRPGRATCKRRCDQQDQRRPSQSFYHLEQPHSVELVGAFPHVIAYEGAKRIHRKKRGNPQAVPSVAARGVAMRVGLHTARSFSAKFGSYLAGLSVRALEVVGKLALYMLAARALGAAEAGLFFICINAPGRRRRRHRDLRARIARRSLCLQASRSSRGRWRFRLPRLSRRP